MHFGNNIPETIAIIFCFIFAILYLRFLFSGLDRLVPKPRPRSGFELEAESIDEEISIEAKRREEMVQKVGHYSISNPEKVASIINKWLLENGG